MPWRQTLLYQYIAMPHIPQDTLDSIATQGLREACRTGIIVFSPDFSSKELMTGSQSLPLLRLASKLAAARKEELAHQQYRISSGYVDEEKLRQHLEGIVSMCRALDKPEAWAAVDEKMNIPKEVPYPVLDDILGQAIPRSKALVLFTTWLCVTECAPQTIERIRDCVGSLFEPGASPVAKHLMGVHDTAQAPLPTVSTVQTQSCVATPPIASGVSLRQNTTKPAPPTHVIIPKGVITMGVNARKRRRGNDEEQEDSEELLTPRKRKKSPGAKSQSGTLNTPVRDDEAGSSRQTRSSARRGNQGGASFGLILLGTTHASGRGETPRLFL
ncbi:hypothetical protein BDV98DRAFT_567964 [Pterulicium gracile]|uniref:Uncharacterized protein n=1 Tax=Pterulicium gracile TaxID=1884261 RepID=A0A5C3QIM0_9AGAR|nr:hypothetical protein BDV98DRAFT_567964 [Pterula gracilis]